MFFLIGHAISDLNYYVATFLPPAVMALGGLGNIFSLLIFILSPLRKLRSSPFLIGLSVAHLVSLTCVFIMWLEKVDIFLVGKPVWCQLLNFLFHMSNFLGVAFVLCFTVERYISFCWYRNSTLHASGKSVQRKCVVVTVVLVILTGLIYSFLFGMLGSKNDVCRFIPLPGYNLNTKKIPMYILYFMYVIIGLLLLITLGLDMCIMITILRRGRNQRDTNPRGVYNGGDSRSLHTDFNESVDNVSIGHADDLTGGRDTCNRSKAGTLPRPLRIIRSRELRRSRSLLSIRSKINATRMLFAASLTFTIMKLFFAGLQFFKAVLFFSKRSAGYVPNETLNNLVVSLYIVSLAVGFIVYMFSGQNFREAIKMLLTCQYGRCCAHSTCGKGRPRRRPRMVTEDPETENSGMADSVSRYIDDGNSHISVRPS